LQWLRKLAADVDPVVAAGAARNVAELGLDAEVQRIDARAWSDAGVRFDAIVSHLPYGRSASIKGVDRDVLYAEFLETAACVLSSGGRAVLMAPRGVLPTAPRSLEVIDRFEE
jgi:tRNA G10  N-methylase Trm11